MANALIRYNDDFSEFELVLPDGTHLEADSVPEGGISTIEHPDDPSQAFMAVFVNYDESDSNLEQNKVYALVPVPTEIEEECDFEAEDEDDSEGDQPVAVA